MYGFDTVHQIRSVHGRGDNVVHDRAVLSVLSGAEAAIADATTSWPELLAAQLLHCYPGLRPQVLTGAWGFGESRTPVMLGCAVVHPQSCPNAMAGNERVADNGS